MHIPAFLTKGLVLGEFPLPVGDFKRSQGPQNIMIPSKSSDDPEVALTQLLANDVLVVTRQLEMLNIFVGFEQSNRYVICEALGYIVEEPRGLLSMFSRQFFRTHRPFRALVMDLDGSPILWRPQDSQSPMLHVEQSLDTFAEVQQEWHPWRRKYNMFLKAAPIRVLTPTSESELQPKGALEPHFKQFARIDEGLWAWHFVVRDADGDGMATISRAFRGFGREASQSSRTPANNIGYSWHSDGHWSGFPVWWSSGEFR
ncbi:Scramblase-domain-containing protein [Scleroderma yunnanense]